MSDIRRVPATRAMVVDLAPRLRKADVDEVYAATGRKARDALIEAFDLADHVSALLVDGRCEAVAGTVPHPTDGLGVIWMLASDKATLKRRPFLETNRGFIAECLERHEALSNFVDERNTQAIRWLRWLGFRILDPRPFGFLGLPFRQFWMDRPATSVSLAKTRQRPSQMGEVISEEV